MNIKRKHEFSDSESDSDSNPDSGPQLSATNSCACGECMNCVHCFFEENWTYELEGANVWTYAPRNGSINNNNEITRLLDGQYRSRKWFIGSTQLNLDHRRDFCMNSYIGFTLDKYENLYIMKLWSTSSVKIFVEEYELVDTSWQVIKAGDTIRIGAQLYGKLVHDMNIRPKTYNQFKISHGFM